MKNTAKSTTDLKAIKAALKLDGTIFNIKGKTSREKNAEGVYVEVPEQFKTSMHISEYGDKQPIHSFSQNHFLSSSMNVKRFGSTKISLYTCSPFSKIFKQTLLIAHITIVSVKSTEVIEPVKKKKRKGPVVINNMEIGGEAWLSQ